MNCAVANVCNALFSVFFLLFIFSFFFCFIAIVKSVIAAYLLVLASHEEKLTSHPLKHALEDLMPMPSFFNGYQLYILYRRKQQQKGHWTLFFCFLSDVQ